MSDKTFSIPGTLPREKRRSAWPALACALIVAAGILAYSDSFNGPFIYDDLNSIRDNLTLRHFPALENLAPPSSNPISRKPVVNLTLAINYALGGPEVRGFHAVNLLIHLLAALTLFGVVQRTLRLPRLRDRFGRASTALATVVALIWTLHPLQTEAVTYLTQRTESLMGLLYLLTLYCAIRSTAEAERKRKPFLTVSASPRLRVFCWSAAAIASCALGMGAKEVMATAPVVVLLYDRTFLSGSFREALLRRRGLYLGLAATWGILGALLIAYRWGGTTGAGFGLSARPWEYARTQPGVILNYLRLSFWPSPLCLDYAWPIARTFRKIAPAAVIVLLLLAGTAWALRRTPALGFLGAWFFLILAPSSSVVPIVAEVAAERRMYLPLAALVAGAVVAIWRLGELGVRGVAVSPGRRQTLGRVAATAAVLSVAGALGCLTFARNLDYRSGLAIWKDTTDKRKDNARAWIMLGTQHMCARNYEEAVRCLTTAIGLKPIFSQAYSTRALVYLLMQRYDEALRDCDQAIALNRYDADAWYGRGDAEAKTGRFEEAVRDLSKAIDLLPSHVEAYNDRAVARYFMKDYDQALADVRAVQRLGGEPPPGFLEALNQARSRPQAPGAAKQGM